MRLSEEAMRAILAGAAITAVSVVCSFLPVWIWLTIDPVIRLADIYTSAVVLPALIAPACSFFILRARMRAERLAKENDRLANHDELTGLPNRRAFFAQADALASSAHPSTDVFVCAIADIDNFKGINDTFGHEMGDHVLKAVADTLADLAGGEIILARLGGEEFALAGLFPSETAARIRVEALVREVSRRHRAGRLAVTLSLGWCVAGAGETLSSQLSRADHALYAAKRGGKDRAARYREETQAEVA